MQMITEETSQSIQPQYGDYEQKDMIKQYEYVSWDTKQYKSILKKIKIILTKENEILYFVDGQLLKIQQYKKLDLELEVCTNLEQITNLEWLGQYGESSQKIGKWKATWIGEPLNNVGGWYFNDGKKQGLWNLLIKNYKSQAQVYEFGEYVNGLRQNSWVYMQQQKKIGGGKYNLKGQKNGKWVELIDGFQNNTQVIYTGEYKNDRKVGLWEILYKKYDGQPQQFIGGGSYDNEGNGMKIGKWIDLDERFFNGRQVTHQGVYKYGKKVGRWDIWFDWGLLKQIGGGNYDQLSNGIKIGNWIDLDEGFYNGKQVTHKGEYQNGKKVGRWDIWYRDHIIGRNKQIGGGSYDERGCCTKIGNWIDLDDGFYYDDQITYNGEYQKGQKVGRWDINYFNKQIGGGSYDERGFETKIGKWIDLDEGFSNGKQVTYNGEYQNGKKAGRWEIWQKDCQSERNQQIGGGSYDKICHGVKTGKWIELDDLFQFIKQLVNKGEYNHGKKVGRWDICLIKKGIIFGLNYEKIGGGSYDVRGNGLKTGNWIDLDDWFYRSQYTSKEITYDGNYQNSKKVGRWDIWLKVWGTGQKKKIGGGSYDEDGIKQGNWVEMSKELNDSSQATCNGEYINGKKVGIWLVIDLKDNKKHGEIIYEN